jgi:hypothetical protein
MGSFLIWVDQVSWIAQLKKRMTIAVKKRKVQTRGFIVFFRADEFVRTIVINVASNIEIKRHSIIKKKHVGLLRSKQ